MPDLEKITDMEDKSPKKIKVEKEIFRRQSEKPFTWKRLKGIQFEDDDIIHIGYDEGHCSENNSWDPHYYAVVTRMIEETDEQFAKRQKRIEQDAKWARERRYENYLKLKEEFEPK
jgi:hypothetical protein